MSDKIKIEELNENEITEQVLTNVAYGDFQALFKKIGIDTIFRAGKKKVDMIKEAIGALKIKKELEQQGSKEEIVDVIKKNQEAKDKEETEQKEKSQSDLEKAIKEMDLSPEQIANNIRNIKGMLKDNFQAHRPILLQKLAILESL